MPQAALGICEARFKRLLKRSPALLGPTHREACAAAFSPRQLQPLFDRISQ